MRLCDVGEAIQEVMESYEVELDGKTYQGAFLYTCTSTAGTTVVAYTSNMLMLLCKYICW